jgi:hypothetical protein
MMLDKLKTLFKKKPEPVTEKPKRSRKKRDDRSPLEIRRSEEKARADAAKEAWVDVVFNVDPIDPHSGYADIDWNDKFIADLVRHGYQIRPTDSDQDIVYRWYIEVCRNEVLETYAQEEAQMPSRFTKTRDIGDGLSEVS